MSDERKTTKLLLSDLDYLRRHSLLPVDRINDLLKKMQAASPPLSLQIERNVAEPIRDALTERLAEVGFDQNSEPNEEGKFLEDIIDRLFIA